LAIILESRVSGQVGKLMEEKDPELEKMKI
jgi:hypothetical protein